MSVAGFMLPWKCDSFICRRLIERRERQGKFGDGMSTEKEPLIIKRYASRRLYNPETSEYVTLQEIAEFIRAGKDVRIIDRKTGDDLTRQYLVQIIADHESKGEEVLPLDVLMEVVRTYNNEGGEVVPRFLDMSFRMLKENQSQIVENMRAMSDPMFAFRGFERQQKDAIASFMEFWTKGGNGQMRDEAPKEATGDDSELDRIKKQLAELQSKVSNL